MVHDETVQPTNQHILPEWEGFAGHQYTADDAIQAIMGALVDDHGAQQAIAIHGLALTMLLLQKNRKYGNSATDPLSVFSGLNAADRMRVRMDDKLSRMSRGDNNSDQEDAYVDLAGYLLLYLTLDP